MEDRKSTTILASASKYGISSLVRTLLAKDVDVNHKDKHGRTAIMWATLFNHNDIVQMLVTAKANVNCKEGGSSERTLLFHAADRGCDNIVETLLAAGADVDHESGSKNTAIMVAADNGHTNIIRLLIHAGANVDHTNMFERTAIIHAARHGHSKAVKTLVAAGANIDHKDKEGYTALMWASQNGYSDVVKVLIEANADVSKRNHEKKSAIQIASYMNEIECVNLLTHMPPLDQVWDSMREINSKETTKPLSHMWASRCTMSFVLIPLIARRRKKNKEDDNDDDISNNAMGRLHQSCRYLLEPHALVQISQYM